MDGGGYTNDRFSCQTVEETSDLPPDVVCRLSCGKRIEFYGFCTAG